MNINKLAYLYEIVGTFLAFFALFYILFSVCWELGTIFLGSALFLIGFAIENTD